MWDGNSHPTPETPNISHRRDPSNCWPRYVGHMSINAECSCRSSHAIKWEVQPLSFVLPHLFILFFFSKGRKHNDALRLPPCGHSNHRTAAGVLKFKLVSNAPFNSGPCSETWLSMTWPDLTWRRSVPWSLITTQYWHLLSVTSAKCWLQSNVQILQHKYKHCP